MPPRKPKKGHSLADLHPELIDEWSKENELTPWDYKEFSHYNAKWVCSVCGYEWESVISSRSNGHGCPKCGVESRSLKRSFVAFKDSLGFLYPELGSEYSKNNKYRKDEIGPRSGYIASWECTRCGYIYRKQILKRVLGSGCKKCWSRELSQLKREPRDGNSLLEVFPKLATRFDLDLNEVGPEKVSSHSSLKFYWKCGSGFNHSFKATVANMVNKETLCPVCSGYIYSPETSLASMDPDLAQEFDVELNNITPNKVRYGTSKPYYWKCKLGHQFYVDINSRKYYQTGCPLCFTSNHTSCIETNLRTSLSSLGFSQELRSKVGHWNVDLLNSDTKTVIEFDGSYYHSLKGAYAQDRKKSLDLLDQGYKVIRVREMTKKYQLKSLRISKKLDYHEIFWDNKYTGVYPENVDPEILEEIKTLVLQPNYI